ncbi:MAG: NADH-quinone oxidoreductase subunit L [Paracoccaceae bacterium]
MYAAILLLPLLGAVVAGLFGRSIGERASMALTTSILFACASMSWIALLGFDPEAPSRIVLFEWIASGDLNVSWSIRVDTLPHVMLVVVTTVSALVHCYSIGYMEHDDSKTRFFSYLSLFTFAMLALVTGDNLLQVFFGWEGVGVASYLLIGFWYKKNSANAAAMKAFIVNRVGDFAFLIGLFLLFMLTGSLRLDDVFAAAPSLAEETVAFLWFEANAVELIAMLLFVGAMGKSAQLFLHTWLPDAMEGPTPVSALIHAATMVTAGVFLVCRMSPVMEFAPTALAVVTVVGASTAFFAASVGLVQNDIKRVIAYSTCSQLGYMFAAAGVGAYEAAMFHLFTHAFFKALLFLGAGSVIHGLDGEQDMRRMGGLRAKMPTTYLMMLLGTLAITGVGIPLLYVLHTPIGFAGFVSKDVILEATYAQGTELSQLAFWLLLISALFTAFYSWRLIFMTFWGETRADRHAFEHAHESPKIMLWPLYPLAGGAVLAGMEFYPEFVGEREGGFWAASIYNRAREGAEPILEAAHHVPAWVAASPFLAMLAGLALAYRFYVVDTTLPARLAEQHQPLYRFLLNKWYFDELYQAVFVRPAMALGRFLWRGGDGRTIDGASDGLAFGVIPRLVRTSARVQSGYVFHYAFAMLIGVSLLVTWFAVTGVR